MHPARVTWLACEDNAVGSRLSQMLISTLLAIIALSEKAHWLSRCVGRPGAFLAHVLHVLQVWDGFQWISGTHDEGETAKAWASS